MKKLTDQQLIDELKARIDLNHRALEDLQTMARKLEVMNQKLKESESLKSHFLSNIRNEINNPLTSIIGLSRQVMENPGRSDTAAMAEMIHGEAFDLDFQMRNIFIAAELEAGDTEPALSRVDIGTTVGGAVALFAHQAARKGLRIKQQVSPGLLFVTDAEKLQVVLNNLLSNAVEFSPGGKTITLRASVEEQCLVLAVEDQGIGIPPEEHEAVFDRFRQLDAGSTKSHRGHGLGLSIVKALVELLGGGIDLKSDRGKGCTFTLSLPEPQTDVPVDVLAKDGNFFLFDQPEKF